VPAYNPSSPRGRRPDRPECADPPTLTRRSLITRAAGAGAALGALGLPRAAAAALAPGFSVDHSFPPGEAPSNPLTIRIIKDPAVAWDRDGDALVAAIPDELLVRGSAVKALGSALTSVATFAGSLRAAARGFPRDAQSVAPPTRSLQLLEDTQLWRITAPTRNSPFAEAVGLNAVYGKADPPAVSPNHVIEPCHSFDSCPGGPPTPIASLGSAFVPAQAEPAVPVVVIDSGYIPSGAATSPPEPAHVALDARVTAAPGYFLDSSVPGWRLCPPDDPLPVPGHPTVLDGVAGHGTFIAGLIANRCRQARLTVVGERRAIAQVPSQGLYSDELSVARSLLRYCTADVVSCGFAFPTFGALASIPFTLIMQWIARTGQQVAVVAPAGNENSARPYWPAADPRVVGVGASDPGESLRAQFAVRSDGYVTSGSNWGHWLQCCARGQSVPSLFVDWTGTTEDEQPPMTTLTFTGWASWSGTSFAAPKVTAAIAAAIAGGTPPLSAFAHVVGAYAGPPVSNPPIPGSPPVPLTNLLLG
jgi:hypothetical protein